MYWGGRIIEITLLPNPDHKRKCFYCKQDSTDEHKLVLDEKYNVNVLICPRCSGNK